MMKREMPFWVFILIAILTIVIFALVMIGVKDQEYRRIAPTPEPIITPMPRPSGSPITLPGPRRRTI